MKKLQWLDSSPTNIITTKIVAVKALVLNACRLKAIKYCSFCFYYVVI